MIVLYVTVPLLPKYTTTIVTSPNDSLFYPVWSGYDRVVRKIPPQRGSKRGYLLKFVSRSLYSILFTAVITHTHTHTLPYLVYLLPAVLVHAAHLGVVVEQQLTAVGVPPHHGAVVEGGQAPAVLVVRGRAQVQQGLGGRGGERQGTTL